LDHRTYFQIYGETFLDELQSEASCEGILPFSNCATKSSFLIPILVAFYILITNLLMVNLLIAIFNDTYTTARDDAINLWNEQYYGIVEEYLDKVWVFVWSF
jgi:hypothetical protein